MAAVVGSKLALSATTSFKGWDAYAERNYHQHPQIIERREILLHSPDLTRCRAGAKGSVSDVARNCATAHEEST
jgi:hypothetical protein